MKALKDLKAIKWYLLLQHISQIMLNAAAATTIKEIKFLVL